MKENSICGDNRFEIIEKAKEMLLNATNIEDSKEEMKVLTNILFRMWQVGLINEEKLEINKLQKENSIEEDIKDIEKYISFTSKRENFSHDTDWNWNKDLANKIEHILSDYKRVLKENEELNKYVIHLTDEQYRTVIDLAQNDINQQWIQKVKDKIEELQKGPLKINENNKYYYETEAYNKIIIQVLQELLEGRK